MKVVFLDIDTQIDFVFPAGSLYVPGAEKLLPVLAALNRFAVASGAELISTACSHAEDDSEFAVFGPHCVRGTVGQRKPAELLVGQRTFEKQHTDLFQAADAEALVAGYDRFVIYGVVTEICVQAAALGLLARGKHVTVVEDATAALDEGKAARFFAQLRAADGAAVMAQSLFAVS